MNERRLKINRRYQSSVCSWCGDMLMLGEDGAVCEACERPHHARCWDKENGCGQAECINAPLRQELDIPVSEEQLAESEMLCPHCRKLLPAGTISCSACQQFTTLSGLYEGERTTAPEARDAFLLGTVSAFVPPVLNLALYSANFKAGGWIPLIIGVRCGWSAVKKSRIAQNQIARDQTLKGVGLAKAAKVLGVIGLALPIAGVVFVIMFFVLMSFSR